MKNIMKKCEDTFPDKENAIEAKLALAVKRRKEFEEHHTAVTNATADMKGYISFHEKCQNWLAEQDEM